MFGFLVVLSNLRLVKYGVQQSSGLSTIVTYVNDLCQREFKGSLSAFADDMNLVLFHY